MITTLNNEQNEFRLSYYPHKLNVFSRMVKECFGKGLEQHRIYGDFKQLNEHSNPAFYIHVVEKSAAAAAITTFSAESDVSV